MNGVLEAAWALIAVRLAGSLTLSALNRAEVRRRRSAPPPSVRAILDEPTRERAADYTLARSRFDALTESWEAALLIALLGSGVLPVLERWTAGWGGAADATWKGAAFIGVVFLGLGALALPFDAWEQFRIETRFGFNRATPGLWILDKLKGAALALVLGFPLLWLLLALVRRAGAGWWLWAAAIVFAVQVLMLVVYPRLILPLFNRLTPLPPGELRDRLAALGERTGFRAGRIEVIDGSRRSTHSNAYFTGFGRFRRIVLFDTLVQQLSPAELEAVLAHEIGHYRRGHIPQRIALSLATLFGGFAILAALARAPWFASAFGFAPGAGAPVFLLCFLLGGTVTFWLTPVLSAWSRHHEYQADAFAREAVGSPAPLVGALRKLSERNLSNLTPHPLFSAFHYSHPTLIEREKALGRGSGGRSTA